MFHTSPPSVHARTVALGQPLRLETAPFPLTPPFLQVVERSQLETHARQVALRGQPRESFLENASQIWCNEILPQWEEKHSLPRTQMLWWEGVPSALRPQLWPLAIGDALQHGEGGYAKWVAAAEPADREAARCLLEEEILQVRGCFLFQ